MMRLLRCLSLGPIILTALLARDVRGATRAETDPGLHWAPRSARLTVENGLPDQTVYSITRDHSGFLWFGTPSGAARFDGRRFKVLRASEPGAFALSSDQASRVFVDREGILWVGTWGGGVNRVDLDSGEVEYWRHRADDADSLASDFVQVFHQARDGRVWIGTGGGLMVYEPGASSLRRAYTADEGSTVLGARRIWSVAESGDGHLWLATNEGLVEFDPVSGSARPRQVVGEDGEHHPFIRFVYVDARDRLWVGSNGEFGRYDPASERLTPVLLPTGVASAQPTVNCALALDERRIWLGTWSGLWLLDTDSGSISTIAHSREAQWFAADDVRDLHRDGSGQLWAATRYNGVVRTELTAPRFRLYSAELAGAGRESGPAVVRSIYPLVGSWWLHTDGALVRADLDRGRFEPVVASRGLRVGRNGPSAYDSQGGMWLATLFGPARLDLASGKVEAVGGLLEAARLNDPNLAYVHRDRQDRLWWATQREGLLLSDMKGRLLERIPPASEGEGGIASEFADCLREDRRGRIWLCSDRGLSLRLPGDKRFRVFRHRPGDPHSLSSDRIQTVFEASDGGIWIGTSAGLDRWNEQGGHVERLPMPAGATMPVQAIAEAGRGTLWLASNGRLLRFDSDARTLAGAPVELDQPGLQFVDNAAASIDAQRLLFGTTQGLLLFQPESHAETHRPLPVEITGVWIDRSLQQLRRRGGVWDPLIVPPGAKVVDFEFAVLDFRSPENNQYAHQLEGFDTGWRAVGNRDDATYTNLPPGEYRLRVRAAGADRVWNEAASSLRIEVRPPWWQDRQLQISAALVLALVAYIGLRLYLHRVKSRERELQRLVDARTQVIADQQGALLMQDKLASLGTLTAGVAHEINNPTNFVYVGNQNLQADLQRFRGELVALAGADADPSVTNFLHRRFDELQGHLSTIRDGAERIRDIVGHLRMFSRLDEAVFKPVQLDDGLRSTVALVRTQYGGAVKIELDLASAQAVECRPAEINQVFMNLVVNACQAVNARFHGSPEGRVEVRSRDQGGSVVVEVRDNGTGIDGQHLARIFEPFFTTKPVGEGSGLGLSISYRIVEQHGGRIDVESTPGSGTCMRVRLPCKVV